MDDQKYDNSAVICVGTTGTGKSSIIKLFCGPHVKVGHTAKSETQESSLFKDRESDRYWLDSQGANDSQGVDDRKVLTDVLKKLHDKKISNIKVIWCISGDCDRAKQEFRTQAKFIKSLGYGVWNSCLIVQKKGAIKPNKIPGVLEAAKDEGGNIRYGDYRLFGYTGIDFMTEADKMEDATLRMIFKYTKPNTDERNQELLDAGYLNNTQIIKHINDRLNRLSSLKIAFAIKKCEKCGVKGDPRFVYEPCHTEKEEYHPWGTVRYHKGHLQHRHGRALRSYHPGATETKYTNHYYHSGELRAPYDGADAVMAIATLGIGTIIKGAAGGYDEEWTCCGGSEGSRGCCNNQTASSKMTCCKQDPGSAGCSEEYQCCGGTRYSTGCITEWDCCSASSGNKGCERKHECCDKDEGKDGCEERCRNCRREWKEGPGCLHSMEHEWPQY